MQSAELERKVITIVQHLYRTAQVVDFDSGALLVGDAGTILFLRNYGSHFKVDTSETMASKIERLLSYPFDGYTFCSGAAGQNWLYRYLFDVGLLENSDLQSLCVDEKLLMICAESELKKGNYDFLHGALGICFSVLRADDQKNIPFFSLCFQLLSELACSEMKMVTDYDFEAQKRKPYVVNLGLAHGIPSILKFCIICFKNGVCQKEAKAMALSIISFLMDNCRKEENKGSYYSNNVTSKDNGGPSRLAWCYGDLGIAYVLYQAGVVFQEKDVANFALGILTHTTTRKKDEDTRVFDAGFCHGSAGVAHIYNRMWHYTSQPDFKIARDFWLQKTLEFAVFENGYVTFNQFAPKNNKYEFNNNLLEGTIGVGLVLLSFLSGDFSWDYCLMLND